MEITVDQVRVVVPTGYSVYTEIVASVDITRFLIVLKYSDDSFDRVATVYDIETYPEVKTPDVPFYRAISATVIYELVSEAIEYSSYTLVRLGRVVTQYDEYVNHFVGSDTHIIVP